MARQFPHWTDRIAYWHVDDLDCAESHEALPHLERQIHALIERLRKEDGGNGCGGNGALKEAGNDTSRDYRLDEGLQYRFRNQETAGESLFAAQRGARLGEPSSQQRPRCGGRIDACRCEAVGRFVEQDRLGRDES
jgi:hypothetical protein